VQLYAHKEPAADPEPEAAADGVPSSSSKAQASPEKAQASPGPSSKVDAGEEPDLDESSKDITQMFGKEALESKAVVPCMTAKELFLDSELILPGIGLKKFKQLECCGAELANYVGVFGKDQCTMYKQTKPRACTLMMGDFLSDRDSFWKYALRQCKQYPVVAICFFDVFSEDPAEAWVPGWAASIKKYLRPLTWTLVVVRNILSKPK